MSEGSVGPLRGQSQFFNHSITNLHLNIKTSFIQETLNLSMCADSSANSSTNTKIRKKSEEKKWVMHHMSGVMCHLSCVMCHLSCVTCHVSCVTCHPFLFKKNQSGGASQWRVCYQWGLPRIVL